MKNGVNEAYTYYNFKNGGLISCYIKTFRKNTRERSCPYLIMTFHEEINIKQTTADKEKRRQNKPGYISCT